MTDKKIASPAVITVSSVAFQACLWVSLPVLVFLFGWFRLSVALPVALLLVTAVCVLFFRKGRLPAPDPVFRPVSVSRGFIAGLAVIFVMLLVCGHGGLVRQSWDWQFRNAVSFDLSLRPWPVVYDHDGPRLLCYYFVYFLPGAVVSRLTGYILPGDIVQLLYAFWGMSIGYTLLVSATGGRARWRVLLLMFFFSGCDSLASLLLAFNTDVGLWWSKPLFIYDYYKFYSLVEQLSQIFNQTIACWVVLPLMYAFRRDPSVVVLLGCLLFVFAPLPCVGIVPAMIYWCVRGLRSLLRIETLAGLAVFAVTAVFYISNRNASSPGVTPTLDSWRIAFLGLWFLIFGVALVLPFIWKRVRGDMSFRLMLITAVLLPLVAVGDSADLGLRAGIPLLLFILYAVASASLGFEHWSFMRKACFSLVVAAGSFGAAWALVGIGDSIAAAGKLGTDTKRFEMVGRLDDPDQNLYYNNFVAEGESFYTRFLAPRDI